MSDAWFYSISGGVLVTMIALELRVPSFRRGLFGDRRRAARNWTYLVSILPTLALIRVASNELEHVVPRLVSWEGLFAVELAGTFLVAELLNWLIHYFKHANGTFWRFHFQHHREENYDIWLTTHLHALEVLFSGCIMSAVLIGLGFTAQATQVYYLFYIAGLTYQHSGQRLSLGPLDRIIVGPAFHRLHHAVKMRGNYGSVLTFWDIVFGTAHWPEPADRTIAVGIRKGREPVGFWKETTYFLRGPEDRAGGPVLSRPLRASSAPPPR